MKTHSERHNRAGPADPKCHRIDLNNSLLRKGMYNNMFIKQFGLDWHFFSSHRGTRLNIHVVTMSIDEAITSRKNSSIRIGEASHEMYKQTSGL